MLFFSLVYKDLQVQKTITRQRKTRNKVEKSVLDYIIVCDVLKNYFESMSIDENRSHVLTKYASTKGVKCKVESDHNILYGVFSIKYDLIHTKVIREVFNFKNQECRKKFFEVSNNTFPSRLTNSLKHWMEHFMNVSKR